MRILSCTSCKKLKFISEFHKNKKHKTGYHNECKKCRNKKDGKNYKNCIICKKELNNWAKFGKKSHGRCINCFKVFKNKLRKIYRCKDCRKEISDYRVTRCLKCQGKIRSNFYRQNPTLHPTFGLIRKGKDNPNYKHGLGYLPYNKEFNKKLKLKIRQRDNFKCQCCGIKESDCFRKLDIHHINYDKMNCKENNLITLCRTCNGKANRNRDYWYNHYNKIIKKG